MTSILHTPTKDHYNYFSVNTTSIDEVIEVLLPKIRPQSQSFYKKELRDSLTQKKTAIIDQHAGNGCFYDIKLFL